MGKALNYERLLPGCNPMVVATPQAECHWRETSKTVGHRLSITTTKSPTGPWFLSTRLTRDWMLCTEQIKESQDKICVWCQKLHGLNLKIGAKPKPLFLRKRSPTDSRSESFGNGDMVIFTHHRGKTLGCMHHAGKLSLLESQHLLDVSAAFIFSQHLL